MSSHTAGQDLQSGASIGSQAVASLPPHAGPSDRDPRLQAGTQPAGPQPSPQMLPPAAAPVLPLRNAQAPGSGAGPDPGQ